MKYVSILLFILEYYVCQFFYTIIIIIIIIIYTLVSLRYAHAQFLRSDAKGIESSQWTCVYMNLLPVCL